MRIVKEIVKFGLVGILNTFVSLFIIFMLMNYFHVSYVLSNLCGYTVAVINSFIWNKLWTFYGKGSIKNEFIIFMVIFVICYLAQLGLLIFLKEVLTLSVDISQILAMIFYMVLNFIGQKYFAFNKKYAGSR